MQTHSILLYDLNFVSECLRTTLRRLKIPKFLGGGGGGGGGMPPPTNCSLWPQSTIIRNIFSPKLKILDRTLKSTCTWLYLFSTSALPGSTSSLPGCTSALPGSTSSLPGSTSALPGSTSALPGCTVPLLYLAI